MRTKIKPRLNWQVQPRLMARLTLALGSGGWWCTDCQQETERIEGEQGQPATCDRCGSYRIQYQPPITDEPMP
jgi:DNA-directed RNA polymerase subunit RPC12/RpoP